MAGKPAYNGKTTWYDDEDENLFDGGNGIDELHGLDGNDTLNGNNGNDHLWGDEGEDTLYGDRGDDTLEGGVGLDTLDGGLGDDTLDGGEDDDRLDGGKGDDEMTGGAGSDVFVLSQGNDSITDFETTDVLIDFEGADEAGYINEIADGYKDLNWSNAFVLNPIDLYGGLDPFSAVLNSGVAMASDANNAGLSFTNPVSDFDFKSGYFTSWEADQEVTFVAYDDGEVVGSATFILGQSKTLIDFSTIGGFTSVDTISIDGGSWVAMDDLTLSYVKDTIDVADGTDITTLIDTAMDDGLGNTTLYYEGGSLTLVGVESGDLSADWFV